MPSALTAATGMHSTARNRSSPASLAKRACAIPTWSAPDGKAFYIVATDLSINLNHDWNRATHAGSKSIVIWDSTDLAHWSPPRLAKVAPDDAGCTWAPEAVYDEGRKAYLAFWASTTGSDNFNKHRIWAAWTKDFVAFDKPFVYLDKPWHVIDADIVRDSGRYYRFSKDDQYKSITHGSQHRPHGTVEGRGQFFPRQVARLRRPGMLLPQTGRRRQAGNLMPDPRPVQQRRRLSALCHPRPGRRAIQARRGLCLSVPVPSRLRAADLSDGIRTPRNSIQGDAMNYRPLGRTGWNVSEISFGAWAIGGAWGERFRRRVFGGVALPPWMRA